MEALRPCNGVTSRIALCHNARSLRRRAGMLVLSATFRRLTVFNENNMETPWSVRTEFDVLLYIRRARWAGDEVDDSRQSRRRAIRSQPVQSILIAGNYLISADDYDVGIGQEIQRRWGRW